MLNSCNSSRTTSDWPPAKVPGCFLQCWSVTQALNHSYAIELKLMFVCVCGALFLLTHSLSSSFFLVCFLSGEESFSPTKVEIILNPDGKPRPLGVVEFETRHQCERTLHSWSFLHRQPLEAEDGLESQQQSQAYVLPLHMTVFPDVVGGTCSLHAVSNS